MANPSYDPKKHPYRGLPASDAPGHFAGAITPSDSVAVSIAPGGTYPKQLYIGVSGDVTVIAAGDASNGGLGTPVLFKSHPVGYLNLQVRAVMLTGTTATNILGLSD